LNRRENLPVRRVEILKSAGLLFVFRPSACVRTLAASSSAFSRRSSSVSTVAPRSSLPTGPRLSVIESTETSFALSDEAKFERVAISGDFGGQDAPAMELAECHITSAVFTGASLPDLKLTDVLVDGADFSGVDLEGASLTRVAFRDCRLSGVLMPQSRLRDVAFSDCKCDGANFRMLDAERVSFNHVDLIEADFYAAKLFDARFFDCALEGAQFSQASLPKARFHGSTLDGLKGVEYMKEIVIDSAQVLVLALPMFTALGIQIEDERESSDSA
jgi:Pentapeptide repeats (9 copies)/Pentapeptide repeats (8 copies)